MHSRPPSIAIFAIPESGVNVLEVMTDLRGVVSELAENELKRNGLHIFSDYDGTHYIMDSISMVRNNLLLGMMLVVGGSSIWFFIPPGWPKMAALGMIGLGCLSVVSLNTCPKQVAVKVTDEESSSS